jgi:predicted outer membrane repeat protein
MIPLPLRPWLNRMARRSPVRRRRTNQPTRSASRLVLECLEGRCVPSTVTNLSDHDPGSLRDAIATTPVGGTVDFQPGLSGPITLTTGELGINKDVTIAGPGADVITVSGNHASRVFDVGDALTVNISGLTISDGSVNNANGGGIDNQGTLTVTNSTLSGNSAGYYGGGIENDGGTVTVTNSTLSGNSAELGGGIYSTGTLTVIASTFSGNSALDGGGIENGGGTLTVTDCTLSGNSAELGGGIVNFGTLTVTDCTLSGNSAGTNTNGSGGGIDNFGTLTVTDCTLSGNSAGVNGGGIANFGTLTVTDCTLSGNSASIGGGISNYINRTLTITNSTLSGNSAVDGGGGISNFLGTVTLGNTIVAENTAPGSPDLSGELNSQGHNLIGDGTGGSGYDPTDLVGTSSNPIDPRLGPLQDNSGPTQTMALMPGSPALNAGDPTQLGSPDQRGVVRTGGINIGAYQASASAFILTAPDTVDPGVPFDMTLTAVDAFGQMAVGYTGSVTFSSSDGDPAVVLPPDYTFTLADAGTVVFPGGVTLITEGDQTITATDTSDGTITATATVTVTSGNAPRLVWTVANGPATPGTVPAQPSNRQAAHETSEGQAARSEAASVPVPLAMARHATDAVFEGWDTTTDGLALNWT